MTVFHRRAFLAAGAATLATARAAASNRVRLAILGVRGRGADLAREFAREPDAEIVALCDVDDASFAKPLGALASITPTQPRTEKDFRRILDDRSIDAVAIATPDHWHALLTVFACQAGKDVYCEKPASHNIVEGRRMVQASRKYHRVVQLGTQRRSFPAVQEAIEVVHSGVLGHVGMARAWIHGKRPSIGHGKPTPVPAGVDYELWQGPAPDRPFYPNRFHYNWHWFWNWGTGELGNNGIHAVDVARWGLKVDAPTAVVSAGGKYAFDDDQEVPDTQVVTWEFPGCCLVWEHRMWSRHGTEGSAFGIAFYGERGTLLINESRWHIEDPDGMPAENARPGKPPAGPSHVRNFLECVRSRNKPHADIEIGHLSTRLCHLGNIAQRVGRRLTFDPAREAFRNDPEADALLAREYSRRFAMPGQV